MLLVLDNFEHILDDTSFVIALIRGAPNVKLLVTSQERLNLREEWLYEIEAFSCLSEATYQNSSAYRLFMQRAQQVNPHYTTAPGDVPCMVEICRFVGGLPLGIELAASWVRLFPPCDIVQEMQSGLDFLTSSLQDIPDRQRSLRAVFEYSWQLLTDQEQETFSRLALFRGSFNIPAALKIIQVSLSSLITLADKSLMRQTQHGRYEIPPVLQEYGRARLNALANRRRLEEQFASYYLEAVAALETSLKSSQQKEALRQLRVDLENVRQAWRWGLAHKRLDSLSAALPALLLFFEMRSAVQEGARLFAQAIEALRQDEHWRLLGRLHIVLGACLVRQGEQAAGRQQVAQGMEELRPFQDQQMLALGHFYLGISHETEGDLQEAADSLQQSWQVFQQEKDRWGTANALNALGNVYLRQEIYDEARQVYQESLMLRRHIGDQRGIAISYHNMGNVPVALGNYGEAQRYFEKSLEINRELNDRRGIGHALNNIGYTAYLLGHYVRAEKYLREGLTYLTDIGEQLGIAHVRQNLGHVALAREEWLEAKQFYESSLVHFQAVGDRLNVAEVMQDLEKVESHLMRT
jgi:predicted ATPase